MQDRDDDARRAAEEAEALLTGERAEEVEVRFSTFPAREVLAIFEVLRALKMAHEVSFQLGEITQTQRVESSTDLLYRSFRESTRSVGRAKEPADVELNYLEIEGFSRELRGSFEAVVTMIRHLGYPEPEIFTAQIPLILNAAFVAAGGKDNSDLRSSWMKYIEPEQA